MKKVAVVLSGSGFKDGSEITEVISSLICLGKEGAQHRCFAPDITMPAVNHLTGAAEAPRNVLHESARIARGQIEDIKNLKEEEFDAVLFPGGYGAATNLCDWSTKGSACTVNPDVEKVVQSFFKKGKPIAAICIAPVIIAKVLGKHKVIVTIGDDKATASEIVKTGAFHENCPVTEYISDRNHKVLSTPAYMYNAKPHAVFLGISKMLREFLEMA
jgi:enhancing lycopene biosynthesis protein 2